MCGSSRAVRGCRAIGDRLRRHVPLLAILASAAALRLWSVDFGLPGRFRPDEGFMVLKAFRVLQGEFDPDYYLVYPTLFLYTITSVLFLVQTLGELLRAFGSETFAAFVAAREAAPIYLIGRLTTVTMGVAGVFITYLLGRDAFGRTVGLLGALLLAFNFAHARESHFATTDIAVTTLTTCVLWRLVTLARRDKLGDYLLVGALVGLSVSTKYTAAIVALPCLVAHGIRLSANRGQLSRVLLLDRPVAAIVTGFIAFAATSPAVFFHRERFWNAVTYTGGYLFDGDMGAVSNEQMYSGWPWLLGFGLRYGAGHVPEALILAGVGYAIYLVARHREGGAAALLLLGFVAGVLIPYLSTVVLFFRYMAFAMPVLCLLAARVLVAAGDGRISAKAGWRLVAGSLVLLALVAEPLYRIVSFNRVAARIDTRQLARDWIESNVPENDPIIVRPHLKYTHPQLPRRDRYIDFSTYRQGRDRNLPRFRSAWFIVDSHPIKGFSPEPPPAMRRFLEHEATVAMRFSPFVEGRSHEAVFDPADAFYIPVAGFDAVIRPGPQLTIYHAVKAMKTGTRSAAADVDDTQD